jgi:hypothetical protein
MGQPRVARRRGGLRDLYSADTAEARGGGRFRWFFRTCLAAAVGSVAIVAALFGASDPNDGRSGSGLSRLRTISSSVQIEPPAPVATVPDGLAWATPKSDRLEATTGAMVTRYIVQDSIRQRRGSREYIQNKPFARILARLVAVRADAAGAVPAFNPIRLYGNSTPIGESDDSPSASGTHPNGVAQRVVELLGSILPTEDGQELDAGEVTDLVERARASAREALTMRPGFLPEGVNEPEPAKPKAAA